ncbi:MAG: ATP-binding protein [Nannocystaceae bacterium]
MTAPPGFTIGETLHEGSRATVLRAVRERDGRAVLLKIARSRPPPPLVVADFRREYHLSATLRGDRLTRALDLVESDEAVALVLDDLPGMPLGHARPGPLRDEAFFSIALPLCDALAELHNQRVIHGDVKPANVLVDPAGEVSLTDFSLAMRFEEAALRAPSLIGTLAYIAPEQTGRVHRTVDHRADLYSLGVTFFELLAGHLPFRERDPAEIVHAHLAQRPPSLLEVGVPATLAAIVERLPRIPTGAIRACTASAATSSGARRSGRALLPRRRRSTGAPWACASTRRRGDRRRPARAIRRSCGGGIEVALILGPEGAGRTATLDALGGALPAASAVVRGDFDVYRRDIPFAALLRGLEGLGDRLAAEDEAARTRRIARIEAACGSALSMVVELLPRLRAHFVAGGAPPNGAAAQNRLQIALGRLMQAFTEPEAPLCLLLDDLHAADAASLQVIQGLVTDPDTRNLLVVATAGGRGDVGPGALAEWLARVRASRVKIVELALDPLEAPTIAELLGEAMGSTATGTRPLADAIHGATGGLPQRIQALLPRLVRAGVLAFDHGRGGWRWELAAIPRIAAAVGAEGALTIDDLAAMTPATRERLEIAACIGHEFDLTSAAAIVGEAPEATRSALVPALRGRLLAVRGGDGERLRFVHERARATIYGAIAADRLGPLRLRVGRVLLAEAEARGSIDEVLLDAVAHLNAGAAAITDAGERRRLAELNLRAGRRAKLAAAYDAALGLLRAALTLLGESDESGESPRAGGRLAILVHREIGECEHLAGRPERGEAAFTALLESTTSVIDRAEIAAARVALLISRGEARAGLAIALSTLRELGVEIADDEAGRRASLAALAREDASAPLEGLRSADGSLERALASLLGGAMIATSLGDPILFELLVHLQLRVAPRGGSRVDAAYAHFARAFQLCGDLEAHAASREWAARGEALLAAVPREAWGSHVEFSLALLAPHHQDLAGALDHLHRAYRAALGEGDFIRASYACSHLLVDKLTLGVPLESLAVEADRYLALMRLTRVASAAASQRVARQTIACLRGQTRGPLSLTDDDDDEDALCREIEASEAAFAQGWYLACKLLLAVVHRREAALGPLLDATDRAPVRASGFLPGDLVAFHAALASAIAIDHGPRDRERHLDRIRRGADRLRRRAAQSPGTHGAMARLVEAELTRLTGDPMAALTAYDQAIEAALAAGAVAHAALATELCGRFHAAAGRTAAARLALGDARHAYARWGATVKARQLERLLGIDEAREEVRPTVDLTTTTSKPGSDRVDLHSVLKASHAFSSQIELPRLSVAILEIVLENAGAERAVLLLREDGETTVRADRAADGREPACAAGTPLGAAEGLPRGLIAEALGSLQPVVVDDALREPALQEDPYVAAIRPRSLLCLPITHQGSTLGALYLENNLIAGAFTRHRLEVLRILTTEIAIALTNARSYAQIVRARAEAEAANQAKSTFLANMSHELRTPLNAIIGYSELLCEEAEDAEESALADDLKKIQRAARHLLSVISDILDLSKIEAGRLALRREAVALDPLLDELRAIVAPLAEVGRNEFVVDAAGDLGSIETDATKLRQVLVNVLGNACKFTEDGEIRLAIRRFARGDGVEFVRFQIRDTGIGIAPDQLSRIFDAFHQVDGTPTRRHGGTGLGLAISRRLAQLLGGDLGVKSTLGEGSTFTIDVPVDPEG